jgi:hypothetical protein
LANLNCETFTCLVNAQTGQVDSLGIDGAAKGYPQPSGQVTEKTSGPFMEFASAKGNGFAGVLS